MNDLYDFHFGICTEINQIIVFIRAVRVVRGYPKKKNMVHSETKKPDRGLTYRGARIIAGE
jgi:hypothetical protein